MPDRPDPPDLEVMADPTIRRRKAAWIDRTGKVFCYTRFDPLPGSTEAREQPPLGLSFGVIVHPDDREEVMEMIARGDIRY